MNSSHQIVVVGGGPVGLWTAAQILLRDPSFQVTIYERHFEYQRRHVLRLDRLSVILYSKKSSSKRYQDFLNEIGVQKTGVGTKYLRTNELETALKSLVLDLGAVIETREIVSCEEAEKRHPDCRCFIAADGSRSKLRQQLLGLHATRQRIIQHLVELKYESTTSTRSLDFIREGYKTQKLLTNCAFEYVGKPSVEGRTPITLRVFVDAVTYDAIPEATFKNPLALETGEIPSSLANDLSTYLNIRERLATDHYCEGSGKITKLVLTTYRATQSCKVRGKALWFLVGDAAMGFPYFRALNCGLMCGSLLARCVRAFETGTRSRFGTIFSYSWLLFWRFHTEQTIALAKHSLLKFFDKYRRFGSSVPWQTTKWSTEEAFSYKSQRHWAFDRS